MSLYFVTQYNVQNYLIESNKEIVSLKKETSEDSEKKDKIEELNEDSKKIHTQVVYHTLSLKVDEDFTFYVEKHSLVINFDVLIPPPEQV
ncbi:hypothetical protein [Flavivirga algicola]|uniref:Uncharacterized protein n=1 Tax=Flavivirga algicola TaxID=2729136 RepID=A0ABX1S0X0_9FLAO|nr:hypothetical protein [Flavivirga algicola]NMH88374.1 hypothetical protein [Flavivirga algicola]